MWYKILDKMDAFIETDTWLWIEAGIMVAVILTAVITYFVRKFMEAWEE